MATKDDAIPTATTMAANTFMAARINTIRDLPILHTRTIVQRATLSAPVPNIGQQKTPVS
jgi:hypothetical protein